MTGPGAADGGVSERAPLGWWAISGAELLGLLRRVSAGEDPDMVYIEAFAYALVERVEGDAA